MHIKYTNDYVKVSFSLSQIQELEDFKPEIDSLYTKTLNKFKTKHQELDKDLVYVDFLIPKEYFVNTVDFINIYNLGYKDIKKYIFKTAKQNVNHKVKVRVWSN